MATTASGRLAGRTYKGALHVHTTCSDGKLTPAQCCRKHRRLGYEFVFITDHDQWNDHSALSTGDFRVFSALELSCRGGREHVVALGVHRWDGSPRCGRRAPGCPGGGRW